MERKRPLPSLKVKLFQELVVANEAILLPVELAGCCYSISIIMEYAGMSLAQLQHFLASPMYFNGLHYVWFLQVVNDQISLHKENLYSLIPNKCK